MTLLVIAFFAGILTVLSPCVLPLLPVIVGGSLAGGTSYRRALTVTVSLGVSVFLFTFLLKVSTAFIMVPPSFWNWLSGGILFLVGLFFIFPDLWDRIPGAARANRESSQLMSKGFMCQNFWGDVLVGAALGPVFTTCSPTYFVVLASVLPASLALGVADILAYILGLCSFLLLISFVGQRILDRVSPAADGYGWFKRIIGVLFLIIGALVVTDSLAAVEAPLYSIFDETRIEQYFLSRGAAVAPGNSQTATSTQSAPAASDAKAAARSAAYLSPAQKALRYSRAAELSSIDAYLNTDGKPILLSQYRGKNVVLVDFWTYSCINCLRTIPYLTSWYQKYKDQGLVIVGVHTPEFAFEHVEQNVADALTRLGIRYPVVLDNEYGTWNAFGNQFWPREYLIDIDGFVVHDHAGEGEYDVTEKAIQDALAERAARLGTNVAIASSTVNISPPDLSAVQSPETYFGSARNEYLGNGTPGASEAQTFAAPQSIYANTLYLDGSWDVEPQYAESLGAASIVYAYGAHDVYLVASAATPVTVTVFLDGKPVGARAGTDVDPKTSTAVIQADRLYSLVHDSTPGTHTIQIKVGGAGLRAYTFTFG
ncbi:MAG: cytochrome c biogenesis protein DipZ [Patescibacteria group bacterium]|nr:cytochrome c biogenesis protein DipZ [Patescibacteria group bacterium]